MTRKIFAGMAAIVLFTLPVCAQVGIGTTTPNSVPDVRGSLALNYRSFSIAMTALATDNTLVFDGSTSRALILPATVDCTGSMYWIKNAGII